MNENLKSDLKSAAWQSNHLRLALSLTVACALNTGGQAIAAPEDARAEKSARNEEKAEARAARDKAARDKIGREKAGGDKVIGEKDKSPNPAPKSDPCPACGRG